MSPNPGDRDIFGRTPRRHPNWDHRRGEPRTFALAWTMFLMLSTLVMFVSMSPAMAVTLDIYRPATRALLTTITAGIVLIWPMVRLSQSRTPGSMSPHIASDLLIVLIPVQALIWPQTLRFLGDWPLDLCAGVAACQAAWGVVVGGLVALALALDPSPGRVGTARGAWMMLLAVVVIGVPLVQVVFGSIGPAMDRGAVPAMMASPLAGVYELIRERAPGPPLAPVPAHWAAIGATSLAGAIVWSCAWAVERAFGRVGA